MHLPDDQVHAALTALYRSGGTAEVGLSTTVPGDKSDTNVTEPAGGGYARKAVTWTAAAAGLQRPTADLPFAVLAWLLGHILNWGNGYAWIDRNGAGQVTALWPLLPDFRGCT